MANLYELKGEFQALWDQVDENTGEIPEEILAKIELVDEDITVKYENYCKVIRNVLAEAAALKEEGDRLITKALARKKNVDTLKKYMAKTMGELGKDKIKGEIFSVTLVKARKVLELDEGVTPDECYLISRQPKLDKKQMIADLKADTELPYARLVDGQRSIMIR